MNNCINYKIPMILIGHLLINQLLSIFLLIWKIPLLLPLIKEHLKEMEDKLSKNSLKFYKMP